MAKLTAGDRAHIEARYRAGERSVVLARAHGVSRQSVNGVLKARGVPARARSRTRVPRDCALCGSALLVRPWQAVRSERSFCGVECYGAFMNDPSSGYLERRASTLAAKKSAIP